MSGILLDKEKKHLFPIHSHRNTRLWCQITVIALLYIISLYYLHSYFCEIVTIGNCLYFWIHPEDLISFYLLMNLPCLRLIIDFAVLHLGSLSAVILPIIVGLLITKCHTTTSTTTWQHLSTWTKALCNVYINYVPVIIVNVRTVLIIFVIAWACS